MRRLDFVLRPHSQTGKRMPRSVRNAKTDETRAWSLNHRESSLL